MCTYLDIGIITIFQDFEIVLLSLTEEAGRLKTSSNDCQYSKTKDKTRCTQCMLRGKLCLNGGGVSRSNIACGRLQANELDMTTPY